MELYSGYIQKLIGEFQCRIQASLTLGMFKSMEQKWGLPCFTC